MSTYDAYTRIANAVDLRGPLLGGFGSTDSIQIIGTTGTPLTLAGRNIGSGAKLAFRLFWTETVDVGVASCSFSVVVSDNADLSSPTILGSETFVSSQMVAGREMDINIPSITEAAAVGQAYIGLAWLASAVPSTGKFSAWIPLGDSPNKPSRLRANYTGPS